MGAAENSKINYSGIQYPVIWIGEKDVRAFVDLEHLRTCDSGDFRPGYRKRGCIVDRSLTHRTVRSVHVVGHIPPFWGYRLPGTRILLLDYDFTGEAAPITLEELKSMIVQADRASGMYVGMAQSPRSYEASIRRLNSFDAVVKEYRIGPKRGWLRKIWAGPFD